MMKRLCFLLFSFFAVAVNAEQIIMIKSKITGSQEQPKVISIVPWQKPEDPNYFGQETVVLGLRPNIFKPLDREDFSKELQYISAMRKSPQK